jgi:Carboxypeptidase regulatory-like domain
MLPRIGRLTSIFLILVALPVSSAPLTRDLTGKVTDMHGNTLKGAAVQLENVRTKAIASYLTQDDGRYYFHDLGADTDYTVKAKYKRWWSKEKYLSRFDERKTAIVDLEIPVE